MSRLREEQLQLLTILNQYRMQIVNEFKSEGCSPYSLCQSLLALQLFLVQNSHLNTAKDVLKENTRNILVLLKNISHNEVPKKHSIKWGDLCKKDQLQTHLNGAAHDYVKHGHVRVNEEVLRRKQNAKDTIQTIDKHSEKTKNQGVQFVAASSLPKGTSLRKKFVPPFKKPEAQKEQEEEPVANKYKGLEEKLVEIIESEILEKGNTIKWTDIAGLGEAKSVINQMIMWPMLRPDIFTGVRAPPKGVLLFGPPGTGKTMIGRAIASEIAATFFSISASSLTSKWVGQSQKLVKTLFAIARAKQPSVIFIDEIDSLLCARKQGEQESSRRVKTEFLIELDGTKTTANERIVIIGATNLPGELDDAVRRRFSKRLYIPLPDLEGRTQLLTNLTNNQAFMLVNEEIQQLAKATKGFSGADLSSLCSEASMMPLRQIQAIERLRTSEVPLTRFNHFQAAMKRVRPSVNKKLIKSFEEFNEQYGSCQFKSLQIEEHY